ncbi:MAG TPA: hypothetical protein VJA66_05270 [Thermoanaerobaculia bacterium]
MLKKLSVTLVLLTCILIGACASQKAPAEAALKAAEDAVNAAASDATKYVPDQWKAVTDALAAAKESFNKGDYKAALAGAQDVTQKVKDAAAAAAAKKDQIVKAWNDMSAGVPGMIEAVKSRVDILSSSKKLPAGLDKAKLESAKASLAAASQAWGDASEAYKAGNVSDAASKAGVAKDKAVEAMGTLGMSVPSAAGAPPAGK